MQTLPSRPASRLGSILRLALAGFSVSTLVVILGSSVGCYAQCAAAPVCDEGDTEVSECPDGVDCYEVEVCGETIECEDKGDPHTPSAG